MTESIIPKDSIVPINFNSADFGKDFVWGTSASAFQTEGACFSDGKSASIWDSFTNKKGKINNSDKADSATEFYTRYRSDLDLIRGLNFKTFRFSLSWPRILPDGIGNTNKKGIEFYNRLIDTCLEQGIEPWITLYHWDLPQALQNKGGWKNRNIINWFVEYAEQAARSFGDRVKNWIVMNEPAIFTARGYLLGKHAPGMRGMRNYLPAMHHAAMCQAAGARAIRSVRANAKIGTTFSVSSIIPADNTEEDCIAATQLDAMLNRLFIEPSLGLGYPISDLPFLKGLKKYIRTGDEKQLQFDFDFIGLQYYFRVMAAYSWLSPNKLKEVPAKKRHAPMSSIGYEIYPQGIFPILKKFNTYHGIKKIILTGAGVCLDDVLIENNQIRDIERINYYSKFLESVLLAKQIGVPIKGLFVWSPTDNFEWTEGFAARFGLIYVDYQNQQRYIKDSGYWFKSFLK